MYRALVAEELAALAATDFGKVLQLASEMLAEAAVKVGRAG
jgi:hypothetical protein